MTFKINRLYYIYNKWFWLRISVVIAACVFLGLVYDRGLPYVVFGIAILLTASVIGFLDEPSEFRIEYGELKLKDKLRKYRTYGKHARYKTCYLSVYSASRITLKLLDKYKNVGVITIIGDAYAENENGENVDGKVIIPKKIEFYGVECFYEATQELKKTFPSAEFIEKY